MFTKVPDMVHPLEETFASQIYQAWDGKRGSWEALPPEERAMWREKARRFAMGDTSVAAWQRRVAEAGRPSLVPAWI